MTGVQTWALPILGGSAMIMTCASIGVVQSIAYRQEIGANSEVEDENEVIIETE